MSERGGGTERAREKKVTVPAFFVTLEFLPPLSLVTRLRSKVERKDRRISMFGNYNKIYYRLTLSQISSVKYAPVTSCVVEGSFSMFKNVMSDTHEPKRRQHEEISCALFQKIKI